MNQDIMMRAYRYIEIGDNKKLVTLPIPTATEIADINFSYPEYIEAKIKELQIISDIDELNQILDNWDRIEQVHPYDSQLANIQVEYERALLKGEKPSGKQDTYTPRMQQIIDTYIAEEIEKRETEALKVKRRKLKETSDIRYHAYLDGEYPFAKLYAMDISRAIMPKKLSEYRRYFYGSIDMGYTTQFTEEEFECMTLEEIWNGNKEYLERKAKGQQKRIGKTRKK